MNGDVPATFPIRRMLPCASCGFDLRGRYVGERCPECGVLIDSPGPRWCNAACLDRLARMSMLARTPCLLLLTVPVLFLAGFVVESSSDRVWMATLVAFAVLMPLQVVTQAIAVWRMAMPELGPPRIRALRLAAIVRLCAFTAVVGLILIDALTSFGGTPAAQPIYLTAYAVLPLLAIGSDFVTLRALGSLRHESQAPVSGSHAVLPPLTRWGLLGAYPVLLVPFVGWFLAPIFWTVAMSIGFAQVRAVAQACRQQSP
jgi:hypothetical protein